ncbi:hypothetical protein ACHAPT_011735 [Fusarium lateritium]
MPMLEPTTTIRDDHEYWRCKQSFVDGKICGHKNSIADKQCTVCKSKRDVRDEALDTYMKKIGTLVKTDSKGTEWWQYDSF